MAAVLEQDIEGAIEKYWKTPRYKQARSEAISDALTALVSGGAATTQKILKPMAVAKGLVGGLKAKKPRVAAGYTTGALRTSQKMWKNIRKLATQSFDPEKLSVRGRYRWAPESKIELFPGARRVGEPVSQLDLFHELSHSYQDVLARSGDPSVIKGLGWQRRLQRILPGELVYKADPLEEAARMVSREIMGPELRGLPVDVGKFDYLMRKAIHDAIGKTEQIEKAVMKGGVDINELLRTLGIYLD